MSEPIAEGSYEWCRAEMKRLEVELAKAEAALPKCNGMCLKASDVLDEDARFNVVGDPVARAHRSCPLHGDPEKVAWELDAALKQAEAERDAELARFNQYREWVHEVVAAREKLEVELDSWKRLAEGLQHTLREEVLARGKAEDIIEDAKARHYPVTHGTLTFCGYCSGWDGKRVRGVIGKHPCPVLEDLTLKKETNG